MDSVKTIFASLECDAVLSAPQGLVVTAPADGSVIAQLAQDSERTLAAKAAKSVQAQGAWANVGRAERVGLLEAFAAAIRAHREALAQLITWEAGKTAKEALAEVDGAADTLLKTVKDASLPGINGMARRKERLPAGLVGLITSFNFPLSVAGWTIAPALLAGNAVLWKPSEKTPLVALAVKAVFDAAARGRADLLALLIGGREIGEAMVSHAAVDMISATGSVAMGEGIKAALAARRTHMPPVLELGGNNGVILSQAMTPAHLAWSVQALLTSFLGTSGQRCTNTRRLFVHRRFYEAAVEMLTQKIEAFVASGAIQNPLAGSSNEYGYGPLIDADAYLRLQDAYQRVSEEGGRLLRGERLLEREYPKAYYVAPALALLPGQTTIMQRETFAPLLFVVPYDGGIEEALALVNAPYNAGLVNGIYTLSQKEADYFAQANEAGHSLINSPRGTGTPAYGMGFGGNKASGCGEILNAADPLRAFTRAERYMRVAQNVEIAMKE